MNGYWMGLLLFVLGVGVSSLRAIVVVLREIRDVLKEQI